MSKVVQKIHSERVKSYCKGRDAVQSTSRTLLIDIATPGLLKVPKREIFDSVFFASK
jgi:hypothetical protein